MAQFYRMGKLILIFILTLSLLWMLENTSAEEEAVELKFQVAWEDQNNPIALTNGSNSPNGARRPKIAVAPNGNSVAVVFNHQESASGDDNDPYYIRSDNNGQTWTSLVQVFNSAENSIQPSISIGDDNFAHVVWVENNNKIYYAKQGTWPNSFTRVSDDPGANMIASVDSPKIVATSDTLLDVAWVQIGGGGTPSQNVYHARSTNGGTAWTVTGVFSVPDALAVDMYVQNNTIHLVWQEEFISTPGRWRIMYSRSTDGGTSWSTAIEISDISSNRSAERPTFIRQSGLSRVIFTNKEIGTSAENLDAQLISYVTCQTGCISSGDWSNFANISGTFVGANTLNSETINSSMAMMGNCTIVAFHGTVEGLPDNNEILFNTVKCGNDNWITRQEITASNVRSLRPVLATQGDFVYMAYTESGNNLANDSIQFLRGELEEIFELPILYLPIISNGN